jgi:outer membrane protein assembly factor BamB
VYKDVVIAGFSDGKIRCFRSGEIIWSYKFDNKPYISEVLDNRILIGVGKSCYCFDLVKREIVWKFEAKSLVSASPKAYYEMVYLGCWDGNLYALDSKTGGLKWKYQTGWGIESIPEIKDEVVYFGSLDNHFYALDRKTGELRWSFECKAAIHSSPIVYGGRVFFGCDDGRIYALNKTNGRLAWSFTPEYFIKEDANNYITTPILSNLVVDNGVVYLIVRGYIYALDAQTIGDVQVIKTDLSLVFIGVIIISVTLLLIYFGKKGFGERR